MSVLELIIIAVTAGIFVIVLAVVIALFAIKHGGHIDSFTRRKSIAFANWIKINNYLPDRSGEDWESKDFTPKYYSSAELFDLYLEEKGIKKKS